MPICVRCDRSMEAIFVRRLKDGPVCSKCDTRRCGRCGDLFGEHFMDGKCPAGGGRWKPSRAPAPSAGGETGDECYCGERYCPGYKGHPAPAPAPEETPRGR